MSDNLSYVVMSKPRKLLGLPLWRSRVGIGIDYLPSGRYFLAVMHNDDSRTRKFDTFEEATGAYEREVEQFKNRGYS